MPTIQVIPKTLTDGCEHICEYYNANKPAEWMPIEKLDRDEGGFKIAMTKAEHESHLKWLFRITGNSLSDRNDSIKQLRWTDRGYLTSHLCVGFTEEETQLLFKALTHSLRKNQVLMV
jgi:hypothetical protein